MIERAFQKEVADVLGLSDHECSPITLDQERPLYATAFGFYESGDYRSAAQLFAQLVLTDPYSVHYWSGLASSKQMAQDYLAAVHAWGIVSLLKENDPISHFHAAECFLSLDEKEDALKALNAALELAGKNEMLLEKINLLKTIHYAKF